MDSVSLIRTILGPVRGNILPFSYAVDIAAERIFQQHVAEEDLKLVSDVCRAAAKRLPYYEDPKTVAKSVERCAYRCWKKLKDDHLVNEYIGKPISEIENPRMMVIYLATYAHFDKPYFVMVVEHPEFFTGQLAAVPSLP